jgi:hypothetical protein
MAEARLTIVPHASRGIEDYFAEIARTVAQSPVVLAHDLSFDKREAHMGAIRGRLFMRDGSVLHTREYVSAERDVDRLKYAYHYQNAAEQRGGSHADMGTPEVSGRGVQK